MYVMDLILWQTTYWHLNVDMINEHACVCFRAIVRFLKQYHHPMNIVNTAGASIEMIINKICHQNPVLINHFL